MIFHENEIIGLYLRDLTLKEEIKSSHQHIVLYNHPQLGNVLVINDEIHHIEKYQCFYHEMLVHFPISFIPNVKRVLILGGGSLFAAFEVLKYSSIEQIVLCDFDHKVLDLMQRHYSHAKKVINDSRFLYIEQEGLSYINSEKNKFDLVINDCFNLSLLSQKVGYSIFNKLSNLCCTNGLCVDIIYRHIFDKEITINTLQHLHKEKEINLVLSLVTVPEYPGILHLETIWGNNNNLFQGQKKVINNEQIEFLNGNTNLWFDFFSPAFLPYYLYIPPYIRNMFNL